ncbi:hypothetical protein [Actinokineospora terrae]|uniref:Uncharacterized protein n=1 Tax=Actinokineospora terrae TaxID=155974 RepID=A0A1H9MQ74_9PSEU|nr:hypothetical protein [Actinokineospora terrae]SER25860.1 hypothetical protein SAMN04487818_102278 [Actinokineospora terrae]
MLFRGPERLGWRFSDRTAHKQVFTEPQPVWRGEAVRTPGSLVPSVLLPAACGFLGGARAQARDNALERHLRRVEVDAERRSGDARPVAVGVLVLVLAGGFLSWLVSGVYSWFHGAAALSLGTTTVWAAAVAVPAAAVAWWTWSRVVRGLKNVVCDSWSLSHQRHEQRVVEWMARRDRFDDGERERLATISDWTAAPLSPSVTRVSVIGDNAYGSEALLTVAGASILADGGSVTVLDLTGDIVVGELVRGARQTGYPVAFRLLPTELPEVDLLAGMSGEQVSRLLVEARHDGQARLDPGVRGVDERIMTLVLDVLAAGGLSMGRIAAALRVAMRARVRDTDESLLSLDERSALRRAFSDEYRRQVLPNLRDLEAMTGPLAAMGTGEVSALVGRLRVLSMSSEWTSAQADVLGDLLVGWAARQVIDHPGAVPTLVLTAADRLAVRHLDRLTELCERRGVRLVALFRRFEDVTARMIGRGVVTFMRLNDPQQATRAADFIGREYTFTVSQLSTTLGGQETHSVANSVSNANNYGESHNESTNRSKSRSANRGDSAKSRVPKTTNLSRSKGWSEADTQSWSRTRTWGTTVSDATTESWSDGETRQRVHEHRVDPEVIKNLPDYAMLVIDPSTDGTPRQVRPVELNPEIALLATGKSPWQRP